jgi:hypothetical protein
MVDECVAHSCRGQPAQVEFADGAAAWSEVILQNAGPRRPVGT